ncbi:MAG: aldo/keto reductase [Thermoguttaceae bacterium]
MPAMVSRREFLAGLTTAAGAVALRGRFTFAAETRAKACKADDLVTLGRTGLRPTLLGIGTGTRSGSLQRGLGQEGFTRLVRHALDRGIRYVDTADSYQTHAMVGKALEGVPRDRYFIQSKSFSREPAKILADLDRFLKELRVEYIDSLLMHCMTKGTWPAEMRPVIDVLRDAKQKGKIKAIGVSCHGWEPLAASPQAEGVDVQLARINPRGLVMDEKPERVVEVLRKMHQAGRGIIGMKIFGESGLANRQERLASLKYVLGLGCVDCFTIGFGSIAQLDETIDLVAEAGTLRAAAA